jgi:hypothetical protein
VRFQFHTRTRAPENHVADYEIVFEEGALCGLKLVGGSLWRSRHDQARAERLFVTLPARRLRGRFFDLLRSASRDRRTIPDFKARVLAEYQAQQQAEDRAHFRAEAS